MFRRSSAIGGVLLLLLGVALGYWGSHTKNRSFVASAKAGQESGGAPASASTAAPNMHLRQSPGAVASGREEDDYGLGDSFYRKLKPYPPGGPGERTPLDLWRYAGRGDNSWGSPVLPVSWNKWVEMCQEQKPKLMTDVRAYMAGRYSFTGQAIRGAKMSG